MQDILVYLIVASAAFYLGKTLWTAANGSKSGCGGCGSGCGSKNAPAKPNALLQIEVKSPRK